MSFFTLRTLLFVAEILAASLLLPLLAFAATRLVRRAALRHLVWLTMFGVLALLPLAALLLPAWQIVLTEPAAVPAPVESIALPPMEMLAVPLPEMRDNLPEVRRSKYVAAPAFERIVPQALAQAQAKPVALPMPEPLLTPENGLLLLMLAWAMGLAWNLGRMTLGGIGLMRLRRTSLYFDPLRLSHAAAASGLRATATSPLGALRAQRGGGPLDVRLSPEISGPATFGIFRPLVVLPQAAEGWSTARLAAVLAHEGAHVRRHDIAGQSLARLVCALFWFNPLLWLAARALRREAEFAADDAVLAAGMTPSAYAAELVALVSEIVTPPHRAHLLGAGMADSPLLTRVQSVLATDVSRKGVSGLDMTRMLCLGLAVVLLLGTARVDLALAQEKPVSPAPPARSVSPKVDIDINQNVERKVDVEAQAKARTDAAAAKALAEAEKARSVQSREATGVAARVAELNAQADQLRRRHAELQQQMQALEGQRPDDAEIQQELKRLRTEAGNLRSQAEFLQGRGESLRVTMDAARQSVAQAAQQAKEAQQRAGEAAQRALEAKAQADEAQRQMERDKQSLLEPLSDDDRAALAAARYLKITVSPLEVNERLNVIEKALGLPPTEELRTRVIADFARQKIAALQVIDPRSRSVRLYHVSEIFLAVDRPERDAAVWAELEAIEKQIRGGGSFRNLARQHSQKSTARLGGDTGWRSADQIDADLIATVTALKTGELSRPVRGRDGWYLLGLQAASTVGQQAEETRQVAAAPAGMLPLARLLLPLPPGAPKDAIDNTMKVSMQIRQAAGNCTMLEKISLSPVLKGSVFVNMGDYKLTDLRPEQQKALAQTRPGEVTAPMITDEGVLILARCD